MLKKFILKSLLGINDDLTFYKYNGQAINYERVNSLYIHIPFCRNSCPYCPYFKEIYSEDRALLIAGSIEKEIQLHAENLQNKNFESLYIGGGTPTLMNKALIRHTELLRSLCAVKHTAIETNPEEITERVLSELEEIKCDLISIGVQDFNDKYLKMLGRNYDASTADNAIEQAQKRNFLTVNIDLIFAFPGQTISELDETLERAVDSGADQVTLYPLFTFPYSRAGKHKKLRRVILPDPSQRKKMYFHICDKFTNNGYKQISVWAFLKNQKPRYSSVTRDYYLGIGPSSATYTGRHFLFNSFNLKHYQEQLESGKLPYSIVMDVSDRLERLFWLYWRLYETSVPAGEYENRFNRKLNRDFVKIVIALKLLGYAKKTDENIILNKMGIHRVHLLQNYFAMDYINRIWTESIKTPEPQKITLI